MSKARTLVYRFLELSYVQRMKIAVDLNLTKDRDEGGHDVAFFMIVLERAKEGALLAELWNAVEKAHGDGKYQTNPYAAEAEINKVWRE